MASSLGRDGVFHLAAFAVIFAALLGVACERAVSSYPVKVVFAGKVVDTTVDSIYASCYLDYHRSDKQSGPKCDDLMRAMPAPAPGVLPDREMLRAISVSNSVDFAALYFVQAMLDVPRNRAAQQLFDREFSRFVRNDPAAWDWLRTRSRTYAFLFVPGWAPKPEPQNGTGLPVTRGALERHGFEIRLVDIAETATVDENAQLLAQEIRRYGGRGKRLVVASVGSGGQSAALALSKLLRPEETRAVAAWVNVGGLLRGSVLADAAQHSPTQRLAKAAMTLLDGDFAGVEGLGTEASRARSAPQKLPPHVQVVNYLGVPLSGDVTERARSGYDELRPYGPNDGFTLLADAIVPQGVTLIDLGRDHYLVDPRVEEKSLALVATVLRQLAARGAETATAERRSSAP